MPKASPLTDNKNYRDFLDCRGVTMSIKQPNGNRRYELIPQMQAYDQLRSLWVPHLMYLNQLETNY